MLLILDSPSSSTHKAYECYTFRDVRQSYSHEARPAEYIPLTEMESKSMIIAYAQKSFSDDWDLSNEEENEYWESF